MEISIIENANNAQNRFGKQCMVTAFLSETLVPIRLVGGKTRPQTPMKKWAFAHFSLSRFASAAPTCRRSIE
jgi:hypothetical protein